MDKQSYRKELKRIKAKMYPDYKLDRIGFGFQTMNKKVPLPIFKYVSTAPDMETYKYILMEVL